MNENNRVKGTERNGGYVEGGAGREAGEAMRRKSTAHQGERNDGRITAEALGQTDGDPVTGAGGGRGRVRQKAAASLFPAARKDDMWVHTNNV